MKIVEKRKGENQKDGEGKGRNKRVEKKKGRIYTSRVGKKREERA